MVTLLNILCQEPIEENTVSETPPPVAPELTEIATEIIKAAGQATRVPSRLGALAEIAMASLTDAASGLR